MTGHLGPELSVPITRPSVVEFGQQAMLDYASGVVLLRPASDKCSLVIK